MCYDVDAQPPAPPHGFFELDHDGETGHADAAQDAWRRLLAFLA